MNYTLLACVDSKIEHATKFYGRFEIGPFAPGQGLTVANALRRSLLSQVSGTAITLVKIEGASHEYEMLSGIKESILDIILNLKEIILTSDFEIFSPQKGFLNVKGPGKICARDFKLPSFIHAVDPDQYIATLTANGCLNMKFLICCGKNYITYNPSDFQYFEWLTLLEKTKVLSKSSRTSLLPSVNLGNPLIKKKTSFLYKDIIFFQKDRNFNDYQNKKLPHKKTSIFKTNNSVHFTQPFLDFLLCQKSTLKEKKSWLIKNPKDFSQFFLIKKKKAFSLFLPLFLYQRYFSDSTNFFNKPNENVTTKALTLNLYQYWKNERVFLNNIINNQQNLFYSSALQTRLKSPFTLYKTTNKNFKADALQVKKTFSKMISSHFYTTVPSKDFIPKTQEENYLELNSKKNTTNQKESDSKKRSNSLEFEFQQFKENQINFKRGFFPIDAVFMPVTRVNYLIEATSSSNVSKDLVVLEVWTNGSVHPRHAIHKATKSLLELFLPLQQIKKRLNSKGSQNQALHFSPLTKKKQKISFKNAKFRTSFQNQSQKTGMNSPKVYLETQLANKNQNAETILKKVENFSFDPRILKLDIGNLQLTTRCYRVLKKKNINTISDLLSNSIKTLLAIKGFNLTYLKEVEKSLVQIGFFEKQ